MQIITGKHRHAYEFLIAQAAADAARVRELEARVAHLTAQAEREQHRADNAIDELLATKGLAPVSPPPPLPAISENDPFVEDQGEVDKWRKVIAKAGLVTAMDEAKNA